MFGLKFIIKNFLQVYVSIRKNKKCVNNQINIIHLFYIILLIQIPLMSIFYSALSSVIYLFLFLFPIHIYLRPNVEKKNKF